MAKLKSTSAGKARYGIYKTENRYTKNKAAKLERHLKKYPEDAQAKAALGNISVYSRKAPHSKVAKYHVVNQKTKSGKTFSRKELSRPQKPKASAYVDGVPVLAERSQTAFELALTR